MIRKLLLLLPLFLTACITIPQRQALLSDCFAEQAQVAQCVNGSFIKTQLTQPPGGITGNMPPWAGGNGTSGQVLTSRGNALAPTFQANTGASPPGADTQVIYNSAGAFGANSGLTYDGTGVLTTTRYKLGATTSSASGNGLYLSNTNTVAMSSGGTQGFLLSGSALQFGNASTNPTFGFLGTGATTFNGSVSSTNLTVTGTTIPTTGLSASGGGSLQLSAAGVVGASISSGTSKTLGTAFGVLSTGTKFTASGCSNSTTVGGSTAGTYNSGTTGTCTVTVTLPTASNGWRCTANDMTTPADVMTQTASTTTSCTISGTTVSGDVIIFSAMGF